MKVLAHPRVIRVKHRLHGADDQHPFFGQDGDTVANRVQAVQVVGHHEHGEAEGPLQAEHELIKGGGADRIEAGGGLVEEQDVGVERERAREPGALAHAPRQLGRVLGGGLRGEPHHADLEGGDLVDQSRTEIGVLLERHFDILRHRQRAE